MRDVDWVVLFCQGTEHRGGVTPFYPLTERSVHHTIRLLMAYKTRSLVDLRLSFFIMFLR